MFVALFNILLCIDYSQQNCASTYCFTLPVRSARYSGQFFQGKKRNCKGF